jgi:drug/metabolite transporter (DMT)-like permease
MQVRPPVNERRAVGCALLAVALWSTVATGFKLGLQVLAPLQLLLLGTAVSTAVFWAAAARGGRYRLSAAALRRAALFGLVNPFAYYLVLFQAYDRLPAQIAQPLNYTWAITLAIAAVPLLRQRLARRTLVGIFVSYAGVVLLLTQGRFDGLPRLDWLGVALALGSTVLWAGYWLMGTRSAADPLGLMAWSFLWATIAVALACGLGPGWPALTPRTVLIGGWIGLLEMGFTYLLWQHALRSTGNAARIGQLIFLSPFASFVLIDTVLGERVHASSVIGLAVIVAGLLISAPPSSLRVP